MKFLNVSHIFRIAALESIKLKEEERKRSLAEKSVVGKQEEKPAAPVKKPDFMIRSHPKRSNLVSIITHEDEIIETLSRQQRAPSPPPHPPSKLRSLSPPSPIYGRRSPRAGAPRHWRSRSRSFERGPGLSPRRWASRSPPPRRWSRSPPPLRGRSPPPTARWSSPSFRRSPLRPRRSPPLIRRSPPRGKSPFKRSPRSRSPYR